jgi:hypothetical protein
MYKLAFVAAALAACQNVPSQPAVQQQAIAADKTQDVNVVNSPAVAAQQSGPWSVSLTGAVGVSNSGAPLSIRNVDNPDLNRFQIVRTYTIPEGVINFFQDVTFPRTDQVFVIDHVNVLVELPAGQKPLETAVVPIFSDMGGSPDYMTMEMPFAYRSSFSGIDAFIANERMTVAHLTSQPLRLFVARDSGAGAGLAHFVVAGHMVTP